MAARHPLTHFAVDILPQIQRLSQTDDTLRELLGLMTSVPGDWAVPASGVRVTTNEMKDFQVFYEPKKRTVEPVRFQHGPGSGLRSRTHVNEAASADLPQK